MERNREAMLAVLRQFRVLLRSMREHYRGVEDASQVFEAFDGFLGRLFTIFARLAESQKQLHDFVVIKPG